MARGTPSSHAKKQKTKTILFVNPLLLLGRPFFLLIVLVLSVFQKIARLFKKPKKRGRPAKKKIKPVRKLRRAIHISLGVFLIVLCATFVVFLNVVEQVKDTPDVNVEEIQNPKASIKVFDRNNTLLYTIYKDENRTPILLKEVPMVVRQATLAAEDGQFYNHPGFSIRGMARALYIYLRSGTVTGGSTITQQLAKNVYLSGERTAIRKVKEILLALEIEKSFTKDEILTLYLNQVPYGGVIYGIEAASQMYFGKKITEVTLPEAAFLAGLPMSPSRFSPFITQTDTGLKRKDQVLERMRDEGFITAIEFENAKSKVLSFETEDATLIAPHFVEYVKEQLAKRYSEYLEEGGLTVHTTIDLSIQNTAQAIVREEVDKLIRERVSNGAAVVLSPKNGEILAMVGSREFETEKTDGYVNVATSLRQPGSSIKLVTYAYALSHGMTPSTILDDSPITFRPKGGKPYTPNNYDNRYRGKISLRNAFAESRNIPAVRIMDQYGVPAIFNLGKQMGIESWTNPNNYGLSLTLGGGEITLLELSEVYATVANMGVNVPVTPFISIKDRNGKELYKPEQAPTQVLDPRVAYQIVDILKDNNARAASFGTRSALVIPNHPEVSVKTGTSNNLRDNLAVGMTSEILVATWVGNNDGKPMSRIASGVTGASPIWNKIISKLIENRPVAQWSLPTNLVQSQSCETGKLEWYLVEQLPKCVPKEIAGNTKAAGRPISVELN